MVLGHETLDVYRLSIQDVLVIGKGLDKVESRQRKCELDRMDAMFGRLGGRVIV
jgi:hypothetical protein